jgi:ribosomal protein L11 methyltransferase
MLEMMCRYMTSNEKTLLDYGCGTAILAIAGVKLGIQKAIAIEIDPEAIENAHEYVQINNVSDKIRFYTSNISEIKESGFDVICANIIRSVIQDNIDHIKEKLAPDGKLFISGILLGEEKNMTRTLLERGFRIKKILHQAEWLGIYATA